MIRRNYMWEMIFSRRKMIRRGNVDTVIQRDSVKYQNDGFVFNESFDPFYAEW